MLSESIVTALNWQLNHEQTNAQTYLMFSAIADYNGLPGATSWFAKQSAEETAHAMKIFTYICDQGHVPHLLFVPEFPSQYCGLLELMQKTVEAETNTTAYLKNISVLCKEEGDDQTYQLILEMLKEQIEEEKLALDTLRQVQYSSSNLMVIDQILGAR